MTTWTLALQIAILVLTLAVLVVAAWTFHKTRKIHLGMFRLLQDAKVARQESTALFPQLQALSSLEKQLQLPVPLPAMRGWAGSPDFLLTVAEQVFTRKPATVVECSSGVSTVVVARCLQLNGGGHVYSLEHDPDYAAKTTELLHKYGVADWATVLHAPLVSRGDDTPWYDDGVLPADLGPIEILVVDGPPFHIAPLARLPALPRLLPRLAQSTAIVLDDAARAAEKEIVRRWLAFAPDFQATYLHHEKGCAVLER